MPKTADRARRQLDSIRTEFDQLTKAVLEDIERRGRYTTTPDGYPARTLGDGTSSTTSELTAVEAIANQRGFPDTEGVHPPEPDPTGHAIRELFDAIQQAANLFDTITSRRRYILNVRHAATRKPTTGAGTCQACRRDVPGTDTDRLRSGYCNACNSAWTRAGKPDRRQFELERQQRDASIPTSSDTNPVPYGSSVGAVGR